MQKISRSLKLASLLLATTSVITNSSSAQTRCPGLRALNGACTNPAVVEDAQNRAMIISTVRVSYYGTPSGTVGGPFIPFERLFRDNEIVFGLPTFSYLLAPPVPLAGGGVFVVRTK
jgi:hypothetical protein